MMILHLVEMDRKPNSYNMPVSIASTGVNDATLHLTPLDQFLKLKQKVQRRSWIVLFRIEMLQLIHQHLDVIR